MNTPWYKQFWPWFLIFIPLASFTMGMVLLNLATNTSDSLVVDDYYKEGKAINANLDKEEEARRRNMTSDLLISDGAVSVQFHSGIPQDGQALKLAFYHTTLKERDVTVMLSRDAGGVYRGFTEQPLNGKWRISLTPINEEWKILNVITLPQSDKITFNP